MGSGTGLGPHTWSSDDDDDDYWPSQSYIILLSASGIEPKPCSLEPTYFKVAHHVIVAKHPKTFAA